MKYTFEELKIAWREYIEEPDGVYKDEKWKAYTKIRDEIEFERTKKKKGIVNIFDAFDEEGKH